MIAYVKRSSTFANYAMLNISSYDMTINSIFDDQSTFTAVGSDIDIDAGDFFVCDEFIGRIKTVTPGESDTVQIVCDNILEFFSRQLVYAAGSYCEEFIEDEMTAQYKSIADTSYDMPYLVITAPAETTAFIVPDVTDGLYSLKSYIAKVRRIKNIFTTFTVDGNYLDVDIAVTVPDSYKIVMNDGSHELISETYSNSKVVKVTVLQDSSATDYYLQTDGSVDTSAPSPRIAGEWQGIYLDVTDDAETKVADIFAKNSTSHKIEFRSDNVYNFYDSVSIRINSTVYNSYISRIKKDSGDSRYLYTTGELRVNFTDKLKEMI